MKEYAQNTKQLARTIQGSGRNQKVGFVDNRESTFIQARFLKTMQLYKPPLSVRYHQNERLGDEAEDHVQAIRYYNIAIQQREQAAMGRGGADWGHQEAIKILKNKIATRFAKINNLTSKRRRRRRDDDDPPPPPASGGAKPIGTGNQASWITGIPAW